MLLPHCDSWQLARWRTQFVSRQLLDQLGEQSKRLLQPEHRGARIMELQSALGFPDELFCLALLRRSKQVARPWLRRSCTHVWEGWCRGNCSGEQMSDGSGLA